MAARQPSIHYMRVTGLALLLGAEVNSSVHSFNKHLPGPDSLQPCPRHWGGPKRKETLSLFSRGSRCRRGEASSAVSCLLELLLQRGEASVGVCTGCLTSQRCLFGGGGGRCFQAEGPAGAEVHDFVSSSQGFRAYFPCVQHWSRAAWGVDFMLHMLIGKALSKLPA